MPIDPLTASAILGAVPAVYQMGTGISQGIKARRLGKKKRPEYVVPGEITDNVNLARGAYNASSMYGLPGQGRIQNQLMGSQAQAQEGIMQSQQNPSSMLLGLSSLNQNTNNAIANLGVNAAQFRQSNMMNTQGRLMGANEALARYKEKEWELNKLKPFQDAMQASGALRSGAITNTYGALSSLANTAGNFVNKGSAPSGGIPAHSTGGIATGGASSQTMFDALKNMPEFAGLTDEQIQQQLASLLQK